MIKRLAIIPARSGSKRIKNKNIKFFNGKKLINYSLDSCLKSKLFDKIHISTDSKKIKNMLEKKITIDFLRPKKLSDDKTPLLSVLKHVVEKFSEKKLLFDQIWLIYATNPFINPKILKNCAKNFEKLNKRNKKKFSLITVTEYNYPVQWANKINKNGCLEPIFPKKINIDSKKLDKYYCDAGMLNIYPYNFLNHIKQIKYKPFVLKKYESVDIDNQDDFNFALKLKKNV